ncbi:MAG TPA: 4-hydroxy-tetrahydrodipicolinate synthase [Rubricoccaceae bacterium]|nr:4-hydroxy-tetrahydrodipicolinate synthase [Rubricoccaceae bacterium]
MHQPLFRGTAPALVTPFTDDDRVDEAALRRLIDFQLEGEGGYAGVEALVVLGTTGENPTVTPGERRRVVELVIAHVGGRVPVVVGTGTNDTRQSVAFSKEAAAAGADGLLVVGPYYNKPTPAGLLGHVAAIAEAADRPIVFYNVPGRTGLNATAETQLRLAEEVPAVVGLKEASGNLNQVADILAHRPDGLAVYSGDDDLTLPMLALGADGLVSVIANAVPGAVSELVRRGLAGDFDGARALHFRLLDAMRASFYESNPGPIKAVLAEMGLIGPRLRLPLAPVTEATRERVLAAYRPHVSVHERVPAGV